MFKISFLAIIHRSIVRFQRNFVWGSRTACRHGLHDKNCDFLKSKMADGRHFENGWIAISQWKIVRFWWNLAHYIRYWTWWQSRDQKLNFLKFKMVADAILKIAFLAITHQPIVRFQRNFVWGSRTAWAAGQKCKFLKYKMADSRHFENRKIAISQWKNIRFRWNSVHYSKCWTRLQSRDQKFNVIKFKMAATAILKIVISPYLRETVIGFWQNLAYYSI